MTSIMMCDDHALVMNAMGDLLRKVNFKVIATTLSGKACIEAIQSGLIPDVLILDINMPEMDGLTLLLKLKELKKPSLKTVIVSAYGDMENIRTAMNRGAFDFLTKPINFEDLEITINKTLDEIGLQHLAKTEHDQLVSIQQDLSVARDIQQGILPKTFPPFPGRKDFEIFASMTAAKEVGG
ncbi:MAG: response regulator, partial [Sediminibacterium sp.]|nr:response regulator [Sediminibacterium sp.]